MDTLKSLGFVVVIGAWTAITLAGSIFLIFNNPLFELLLNGTIQHLASFAPALVGLTLFFLVGGLGGALWGGGLAFFNRVPLKSPAWWGAVCWALSVVLNGLVLSASQQPIGEIDRSISFSTYDLHFLFTIDFAIAIGITTLVNAYVMVGKLGRKTLRGRIALWAGAAAAAGFIMTSLAVLFGWGWEVAGPYAGRHYSMISIMNVCNIGAALAGGVSIGWGLLPTYNPPVYDVPQPVAFGEEG